MICFSISFQELLEDTKKSKGFLWKKKTVCTNYNYDYLLSPTLCLVFCQILNWLQDIPQFLQRISVENCHFLKYPAISF